MQHAKQTMALADNRTQIVASCFTKTFPVIRYDTSEEIVIYGTFMKYSLCVDNKCTSRKIMADCTQCSMANIAETSAPISLMQWREFFLQRAARALMPANITALNTAARDCNTSCTAEYRALAIMRA